MMKKLLLSFLLCFSLSASAQTTCDTLSSILSNTTGLGTANFNPGSFLDSLNADFGHSNTLAYYFPLLQACGDSCPQILPCASLDSALYMLSAYGGNGPPYDLLFVEAYLGIVYPNYDALDTASWSQILSCCYSPLINYGSGDTLSHCDQVEYLAILMQNVLPGRHCYPSWLYTNLLQSFLPQLPGLASDSTLSLLCTDLETCKANCLPVCNNEILSGCDSVLSVAYTYDHILANQGMSSDSSLLETLYGIMFGYAPVYNTILSEINNCNPNDTAIFTEILYSVQNLAYSDSAGQYYADMDIMATDTPNLLFSQGNIFVTYDTSLFGANIVSRGAITATRGTIDSFYNLSLKDSAANILKLTLVHDSTNRLINLGVNTNAQLCHLRINISSFDITAVSAYFDTLSMQGASLYQSTPNGIALPYSEVLVSGLVSSLRSGDSSMTFSIANVVIDSSLTHLNFDIIGTGNVPDPLANCVVVAYYNPSLFDSAGVANLLGVGYDGYGDSIYDFIGTAAGGTIIFNLSANGYYDGTDSDQLENFDGIDYATPIAHVTLHIADCHYTPGISIDPYSSSAYYADGISSQSFEPYIPIDTSMASYNNNGNPFCAPPPSVIAWSPSCPSAGSFDVLTITGQNFGAATGIVFFTNADSPATFIPTQPQDIRLWNDNEIDLLIPSVPGEGVAATGQFYVQTAAGQNDSSSHDSISIAYANYNTRSPHNYAEFVYLMDTPYIFKLQSSLFYINTVREGVASLLADLRCQTGINFYLDTTAPAPVDTPSETDGVNLISIQPNNSNAFSGVPGSALAFTKVTPKGTYNNQAQYNNIANYVSDIDISIKATLPCPYGGGCALNEYYNDTSLANDVYDMYTILTHELGHGACLCHTQPKRPGGYNVMYPAIAPGVVTRGYDLDSNTILGIKHIISLGDTMASYSAHSADTAVFTGTCPTVNPMSCVDRYNGINEISSSSSFTAYLYPNPYQDNTIVHVDVSAYGSYTIIMYDVVGHLIAEKVISTGSSFDVPLSDFGASAGLYLIQVSNGRSSIVLKLIKL